MYAPHPKPPYHHIKFYIVMVTIIVAGIFILLLVNNNQDGFDFTGSSIGNTFANSDNITLIKAEKPEILPSTSGMIDVALTFDQIPDLKKETSTDQVDITFINAANLIYVNDDKLELSNLDDIHLKINDFEGNIELNPIGFSMAGTAKRLEVNGVTLSSRDRIKIQFSDVNYHQLAFEKLTIPDLKLPNGNGEAELGEQLSYRLQQDKVEMGYFAGDLILSKDGTALDMKGQAKGISIDGAQLHVNID